MNFGLMPFGNTYIPFLSYQGSGYITDMILLGTVFSVWRYNKIYSRSPEIKSGVISYTLKKTGRFILHLPFVSSALNRASKFLSSLTDED